jgi:TnpA family transposase
VTLIERTAYPRFKRQFTAKELTEIYTPSKSEIAFAYATTKGESNILNLVVILKAFQRLGYFPALTDVPLKIVNHIRSSLKFPSEIVLGYKNRKTMSRHRTAIREFLQVYQYVALVSQFISCGTSEALYIIEGLYKNLSDIQPDTIHADTHGQSTPVFALAHMLGIKLMPRISNWKDLNFYRPDSETVYENIDSLFSETIDWNKIETHWQDILQVVLSVQTGKISSATLLRKLSNYSRKNRLYQAFQELGRVIRTVFLLQYISNMQLRKEITAITNIVEAYHKFAKWFFFGGFGFISKNDPIEQEKAIKYKDLIANAAIFQNVVDLTNILRDLQKEGYLVNREDVAMISPYITAHIKRFGDYFIDMETVPKSLSEMGNLIFA